MVHSLKPLSGNQELVFKALQAVGHAMTAYEILDAVRDAGIRAPAQVYRALEKLSAAGLVHRVESLNAFVACADDHGHEDAETAGADAVGFAICDDCGDVSEFRVPGNAPAMAAAPLKAGFVTEHVTLELHGRCADCIGRVRHDGEVL